MKFMKLISILSILLLWWIISLLGFIKPILLPAPHSVVIEAFNFISSIKGITYLLLSIMRIFIAFIISMALGVSLGIFFGLIKKLEEFFEFPIDFFRSLPVTALYPLFMIFFGIGDTSKVILVIFAASLINMFYSMHGVKNCLKIRLKAANAYRLGKKEIFYRVLLPDSLPSIVSGLRISLSLVLILIIVLEMFTGNTQGIGKRLFDASQTFQIKEMYAVIIIVGILGYFLNKSISLLESKFVHWAGR